MSYEIGTATNYSDLLDKLRTFLTVTLPLTDRWETMRTDDSTSEHQSIWEAPGIAGNVPITSITKVGTTATATYTSPHGKITGDSVVIRGATDALYNGGFTVTVTGGSTLTYTMTGTPGADASGNLHEAANQIYTGVTLYSSVSLDYYNWRINGFTGYVVGNTFNTQPGRISSNIGVPLWNTSIPYIFVANGQRCIVTMNIQNQYQSLYIGKFLPYATPSQYPYPLLIGGMLTTDAATRYDSTGYVSWWKGARANCAMRFVDGTWRTPQMMPFYSIGTHTLRNTKSLSTNDEVTEPGYYGLHSCILSENTTGYVNLYGELDGVYMISGFANTVENTVVIDGVTYYIIRDVYRTGFEDYIAIKLA
jgi:hypothetical protein